MVEPSVDGNLVVRKAVLEAMMDGATDGMLLLDGSGRVRFTNGRVHRLLGVGVETGDILYDVLPPSAASALRARIEQADGAAEMRFELSLEVVPGTPVDVRLVSIDDEIVVMLSPGSAREELVRQFTALANSIPQLAWMADAEGSITWYNQRWYDYTGTTLEEMEGWGWQAVHHPQEVDRVTRRFKRAVERGEPWEDTFPLRNRSGEYRWFLSRALPIRDEKGQVVRWFGTNTDVTEQHELEVALRRSESRYKALANRLQTILDVLPVGVFIADRVGTLQMSNEAARAIWGGVTPLVHKTEFGQYRGWFLDGRELQADDWAMARALEGEEIGAGEEVEIECFDGTRKTILNYALPIVADGSVDGAIAVSVDVTKLRETEDELRELNATLERRVRERTDELEKRNRELQSFAYIASHDLQEPLRKIQTFADLILSHHSESLNEEAFLFLGRLHDASLRMKDLLGDLLSYSRIVTAKRPFMLIDVRRIVDEVLEDFDLALEKVVVVADVQGDLLVEADRTQLRQLINHLVMNACKFSRDGMAPEIRITACQEDARCVLSVEDNGIGFDQKFAERIFEPFERLHGRSAYEGTGMGLAICSRIVDLHGGTITAEGKPGEGSRFVVSLPVRQSAKT